MHLHTLLAFENELEKLAEEDLSTFEKHPKKIIGAGAAGAAGLAGLAHILLPKGGKRGGGGGGGGARVKKVITKAKAVVKKHTAPAVKTPSAKAPTQKAPAKKLTHEEAKKLGYPGAGPKTTANQAQKHLGEEAIQAAREHGMRAGMSTDEHRAVTHANEVAKWLRKHKKSTT